VQNGEGLDVVARKLAAKTAFGVRLNRSRPFGSFAEVAWRQQKGAGRTRERVTRLFIDVARTDNSSSGRGEVATETFGAVSLEWLGREHMQQLLAQS
jgi:hypothetical protein